MNHQLYLIWSANHHLSMVVHCLRLITCWLLCHPSQILTWFQSCSWKVVKCTWCYIFCSSYSCTQSRPHYQDRSQGVNKLPIQAMCMSLFLRNWRYWFGRFHHSYRVWGLGSYRLDLSHTSRTRRPALFCKISPLIECPLYTGPIFLLGVRRSFFLST